MQGYPAVRPELDLVELEDQLTHEVSLLDQIDPEITLGILYTIMLCTKRVLEKLVHKLMC